MSIDKIRLICEQLPGTTEDIKWENNLCFCLASKIYLIVGLDESPVPCSFKVSEDDFFSLSEREGFGQAPYFAKNKWIWTNDIRNLTNKEWTHYIKYSYQLIKSNLPPKTIKTIIE